MARICISAKSILPPVVEKLLMVAGASPALVSSLLIHGDQSVSFDVWLSACQFHTRRAVVNSAFCCATQLPSQFATLRFAALSPSSQRAGLDSGCAGKKTYPWVGDYFLGALKSHLATRAFSPFATTISPSACPIHAAADLMAPGFRRGRCALAAHGRSISAAVFWLPFGCLTTVAPTNLAMQALLLHDPGLSWHRCRCAGGLLFSALALPHRAV